MRGPPIPDGTLTPPDLLHKGRSAAACRRRPQPMCIRPVVIAGQTHIEATGRPARAEDQAGWLRPRERTANVHPSARRERFERSAACGTSEAPFHPAHLGNAEPSPTAARSSKGELSLPPADSEVEPADGRRHPPKTACPRRRCTSSSTAWAPRCRGGPGRQARDRAAREGLWGTPASRENGGHRGKVVRQLPFGRVNDCGAPVIPEVLALTEHRQVEAGTAPLPVRVWTAPLVRERAEGSSHRGSTADRRRGLRRVLRGHGRGVPSQPSRYSRTSGAARTTSPIRKRARVSYLPTC